MLTAASQPDRTVADFVAAPKRTRESCRSASAGNGTVPHFVGERFLRQAGGIKVLHVPYKGNGPAMADIVSARVDMIFGGYGGVAGQLKAGQLRALGVTSPSRIPLLPDVPRSRSKAFLSSATPGFAWWCLQRPPNRSCNGCTML